MQSDIFNAYTRVPKNLKTYVKTKKIFEKIF